MSGARTTGWTRPLNGQEPGCVWKQTAEEIQLPGLWGDGVQDQETGGDPGRQGCGWSASGETGKGTVKSSKE